jgi:hypothetical protein
MLELQQALNSQPAPPGKQLANPWKRNSENSRLRQSQVGSWGSKLTFQAKGVSVDAWTRPLPLQRTPHYLCMQPRKLQVKRNMGRKDFNDSRELRLSQESGGKEGRNAPKI